VDYTISLRQSFNIDFSYGICYNIFTAKSGGFDMEVGIMLYINCEACPIEKLIAMIENKRS
jgi:predicted metal-binding protein